MENIREIVKSIVERSNYNKAIEFGEDICRIANTTANPFEYVKEQFKGSWGIDEGCGLVDYDFENMTLTIVTMNDNKVKVSPSIQLFNLGEENALVPCFLVDMETMEVSAVEPNFEPFRLDNIL